MGPLGWPETVFIVLLALLLFGPKKLPELGRMLGKAITEFRRASSDLRSTFEREMRNLERETEMAKEKTVTRYQDSYNYDYSTYDTTAAHGSELPPGPEIGSDPVEEHASTAPHNEHISASAVEGAESAHSNRPGLSVSPAPGIIASGSLQPERATAEENGAETVHG